MSLNGAWEFEFDDAHAGRRGELGRPRNQKFSRNITVPYCFESKLSGIGDTSFHPRVWYRKTFTLPADWKGKRVLLHFGAVDYRALGVAERHGRSGSTRAATCRSPSTSRRCSTAGANTITVRAEDPPTDRYIPRGKQYWEPKSQRHLLHPHHAASGRPVWLEATGESYLETRAHDARRSMAPCAFEARIATPGCLEFDARSSRDGRAATCGHRDRSAVRRSARAPS